MIFFFLYKQYSSNHIIPLENVLQLLYFGSPHNVVFNKATIISECLSARYGVCVCVFWDWGLCVVIGLLFSWVGLALKFACGYRLSNVPPEP